MKLLFLFLIFLLQGCFPGKGGYIELLKKEEEGSSGYSGKYPQDYESVLIFLKSFEANTPVLEPDSMNHLFAQLNSPNQTVEGIVLDIAFLNNGLNQTFYLINEIIGIYNKKIEFDLETGIIKGFFNRGFNPIEPGPEISPGTLMLFSVKATQEGVETDQFEDLYLLKIDSGEYIWYGNQITELESTALKL